MLKLKRNFDNFQSSASDNASQSHCSPMIPTPSCFFSSEDAYKQKRMRSIDGFGVVPQIAARPSYFASVTTSSATMPGLDSISPKKCRASSPSQISEPMFCLSQVKEIVRTALVEKESSLREEYDKILSARLAEQFASFQKYCEDYLSVVRKDNDFSYIS